MRTGSAARVSGRVLVALSLVFSLSPPSTGCVRAQESSAGPELIPLPSPNRKGELSVEQALNGRRSWRAYKAGKLSLEQIGQVLWAAQGVTHPWEEDRQAAAEAYGEVALGWLRTAPSAGGLYPIEVYLVVGQVEGLDPAVYRYRSIDHALERVLPGEHRISLKEAALGQSSIAYAPATLVIAGVVARTAAKYGQRAERYVLIEVGAVAQNVYLQCETIQLATVILGAFVDDRVNSVLDLAEGEAAYAIMPIGIRRDDHRTVP